MRHGGGGQFWKVKYNYVMGIHPKDAFFYEAERFIGKRVLSCKEWPPQPSVGLPGYTAGRFIVIIEDERIPLYFYAIKLGEGCCIERRR